MRRRRGAELAVLAGLLHLFGQTLENVAHDVGMDRAGVELAEEIVDEADVAFEGLGLVAPTGESEAQVFARAALNLWFCLSLSSRV